MEDWLLGRLFKHKDQPEPRFAFQGTIGWMRALALLVDDDSFQDDAIRDFYKGVPRRTPNPEADTRVFENVLMAYHNQACLTRIASDSVHAYDLCRSAIVAWYYSTYFTASGMVAASSGTSQETHAASARAWQTDIVSKGLVVSPFSLNLWTLVKADCDHAVDEYRAGNTFTQNVLPTNKTEAWGAAVSYLAGTGSYERERVEATVRRDREFRQLGVDSFRTGAARVVRDKAFAKHSVNFLNQAFRYRGKANYRDSVFLTYGNDNSDRMRVFVKDLATVSSTFQRMAAGYITRRVEKGTWNSFVADLKSRSRLSLSPDYLAAPAGGS